VCTTETVPQISEISPSMSYHERHTHLSRAAETEKYIIRPEDKACLPRGSSMLKVQGEGAA
jgi:hypothetical protein